MKSGIRVGMVGCGYISQQVHFPLWASMRRAMVVACADENQGRAQLLGTRYGVKGVYTSVESMLEHEELDLVDVCTPPQTHVDVLSKALENGVDCMVEKPLALKSRDAESVVSLAEDKGLKVYVIHNYSFLPAVKSVKQLVAAGRVGDIRIVDTRYMAPLARERYYSPEHWIHSLPGGVLSTEIAPHLFMLVVEQIGRLARADFCFSKASNASHVVTDEMYSMVVSEKGAVGHIGLSFNSSIPVHTFDVIGTKGVVSADLFTQTVVHHSIPEYSATDTLSYNKLARGKWAISDINQRAASFLRVSANVMLGKYQMRTEGHRYLFERCLDDILNGRSYPVNLSDAVEVVKMVELMGERVVQLNASLSTA